LPQAVTFARRWRSADRLLTQPLIGWLLLFVGFADFDAKRRLPLNSPVHFSAYSVARASVCDQPHEFTD